jgi:thioredoxin-dependent peroxiredoxin
MAEMSVRRMLAVGDSFPLQHLEIDLPAVVYFYPKDNTQGCELESRDFNRLLSDFKAAGVSVVGVSAGDADSAASFASDCDLRFPLVPSEPLCRDAGVMKDFGEYGVLPARVTYLINDQGIIEKVWEVDEIAGHADSVLEIVNTGD